MLRPDETGVRRVIRAVPITKRCLRLLTLPIIPESKLVLPLMRNGQVSLGEPVGNESD